jgi:hypothetical protein
MTRFRWWLPMGSTFSKFLNIFDTLSVDDCPDSWCGYPEADGDVRKIVDYKQLRDFRHEMWAKRRLGAVREHDRFPGCGIRSSEDTTLSVSTFSQDRVIVKSGV